jgi:tRNA pseudouridine32 synthase/23S rRNA pseudouridine746 synthase
VDIVFADASLLVLRKPPGLLAVPGRGADKQDCLSARVQSLHPDALVVHRLDMATSGLMLMARGADMQRALSALFETRQVDKTYVAIVDGLLPVDPLWQLIDLPVWADWEARPLRRVDARGQPSQTRWRCVAHVDGPSPASRLELQPITGRSHQLRVHLQALGHPILGDSLYAPPDIAAKALRLLLHARDLAFVHPLTGARLAFTVAAGF